MKNTKLEKTLLDEFAMAALPICMEIYEQDTYTSIANIVYNMAHAMLIEKLSRGASLARAVKDKKHE